MKLIILKRPIEILENTECRKTFMDFVTARQRLYMKQFNKVLCLDKYDLISDHFLLYTESSQLPVAYMRSVSKKVCQEYEVQIPLYDSIKNLVNHRQALDEFLNATQYPLNMSYLCKDSDQNLEIKELKICNLMIWLAFKDSKEPFGRLGYCATPNCKYRLKDNLKNIGRFYKEIEPFIHPTVPEAHELIMINNISEVFWRDYEKKFGNLYSDHTEISAKTTLQKISA